MGLTAGKPLVVVVLALLAVSPACAQVGDEIPHASYYAASLALYSGEYRTAVRELGRETQRGLRTTQARWIDSVCYYAMYGEALYHQGRNAEALAQFDQACQILLAYPNWMQQVKFRPGLRVDTNRTRRVPPWGRSQRTFAIGQFTGTEQVLLGDLNAEKTISQGGVYRAPMLVRVNVVEVVRMSALAMRRRNEILGPLATQDPLSKQLSSALMAGSLSPANHWSSAWIDLLRGIAQAGVGKLDEADNLLGRSLVIEGQFDHPLTCVGLMEQGRVAALRGDTRRAGQLLAEAGYSAFYFEDYDVLTESTLQGWLNHVATGGAGVYLPLDPIATWAQANRLQHISTKLRLSQADSLLGLNQVMAGATIIEDASRRIGDMRAGLPGIHLMYLQAMSQILQGHYDQGGEALTRAMVAQAGVSLQNFQINRTNAMYDSGAAAPRVALDLYATLLADPTAADWFRNPLDAMTVLAAGHEGAFGRWFLAALERKDVSRALDIAEQSKRRRYWSQQPFGGRMVALRAILESPDTELSREGLAQRQLLLGLFPNYYKLVEAGRQIQSQLQAGPVVGTNTADVKSLGALYDQWDRNATERQQILTQLAVRRLPSSLEYPPMRPAAELQKQLESGEALIEFHAVGEKVFGFLVTNTALNIWQLPDARILRTGLGNFLRALGNYGASREMSLSEIQSSAWRDAAKETYKGIFTNSHLDESKVSILTIVPDNALWYLPFEALIPATGKGDKTLNDLFPVRYGPTASLAISNSRPLRRAQHTGIVATDSKFAGGEAAERDSLIQELTSAVAGPIVLPVPLKEPARLVSPLLDSLLVFDEIQSDTLGDPTYLFPRSRTTSKAIAWITLPFGAPERLVITGFKTESQQGMKATRRESTRPSSARKSMGEAGDEVFQSLCNLMSTGSRSIVLSRWRTGGRTNLDLVREFAKEAVEMPAAEAWQRACLLARENPLDPGHEPRVKRSEEVGEMPKGDHPFFWAGYLLVDTEPRPKKEGDKEAAPAKEEKGKELPAPAKPGEVENKLPPPKTLDAGSDKKTEEVTTEDAAPVKDREAEAAKAESK